MQAMRHDRGVGEDANTDNATNHQHHGARETDGDPKALMAGV